MSNEYFFGISSTPKLSKYVTFLVFTYKTIQWVPIDSYSQDLLYMFDPLF